MVVVGVEVVREGEDGGEGAGDGDQEGEES